MTLVESIFQLNNYILLGCWMLFLSIFLMFYFILFFFFGGGVCKLMKLLLMWSLMQIYSCGQDYYRYCCWYHINNNADICCRIEPKSPTWSVCIRKSGTLSCLILPYHFILDSIPCIHPHDLLRESVSIIYAFTLTTKLEITILFS